MWTEARGVDVNPMKGTMLDTYCKVGMPLYHVKILFFVLPFSSSGEKFLWLNRITDAADVECG